MSLDTCGWWDGVASLPGWYFIETNTPISLLKKIEPAHESSRSYNIPNRIEHNNWLMNTGAAILPYDKNDSYFIYAGEAVNIKSRAREHTHSNHQTASLSLSSYRELQDYEWVFYYLTCDEVMPGSNGDKAIRVCGEQFWRSIYGWPILCKE